MYLLDTDTCVACLRNRPPQVNERFDSHSIVELGVSLITLYELLYGAEKSRDPAASRTLVESFITNVVVFIPDHQTGYEYASIRAGLERLGTPIGPNDLLIAAHARRIGATLVTGNTREFNRVPNLLTENWFTL